MGVQATDRKFDLRGTIGAGGCVTEFTDTEAPAIQQYSTRSVLTWEVNMKKLSRQQVLLVGGQIAAASLHAK